MLSPVVKYHYTYKNMFFTVFDILLYKKSIFFKKLIRQWRILQQII